MSKLVPKQLRRGFSLVELLVACAVFIILTILLIQVFGAVSNTSSLSQRRGEILKQATGAMERISYDLKSFVHSGGLGLFVLKNAAGDDALIFVAPVASDKSPSDARQLAIVKYSIESRSSDLPEFGGWPAMPALSRTVRSFSWSDNIGRYLPLSEPNAESALQTGATQQISPGVIRYEICFKLRDGTQTATPPTDWKQVRSLICGIVAIDRKAASTMTEAQRQSIARQFPKVKDQQRPSEAWQDSLGSLPQTTREILRIYEQTITI